MPGGGNAADAVLTAIMLAFLATIADRGLRIYRENRMTFMA